MPTLTIPEPTYQRLVERAKTLNTSVDDLMAPFFAHLFDTPTPNEISNTDRLTSFREWMKSVQKRSSRYPANYIADDSRESIYEGRGE